MDFDGAFLRALQALGKTSLRLKQEQKEVLEILLTSNVLAQLPTGFGKSMIYQIFPFFRNAMVGKENDTIVLILSPLVAIIQEQVKQLGSFAIHLGEHTVSEFQNACCGGIPLLFATPETWLGNQDCLVLQKLEILREKLHLIVIDEAHCALNWGEFSTRLLPALSCDRIFSRWRSDSFAHTPHTFQKEMAQPSKKISF